MQKLIPSPRTVHWGYFDASLPPIARVRNGEVFRLRSVSASPDDPVPAEWIPPEIPAIFAEVKERGPGPHILTGPVFVENARPGDVLQVDLVSISLGAAYGFNLMRPRRGMFPDAVPAFDNAIIPLDVEQGRAEILPGVWMPTQPFFGILGVAPPPSWGRIDSSAPRQHGGNLDNKELVAGTTLFLPTWVDGALFSAGDGHAAQGDGEVDVTALETCLEGEFRLRVLERFEVTLPIARTPSHLITMGFHEDLDRAAEIAVTCFVQFMERYCRLSWRDAFRLASVAGDLRITQVVNGVKGVHLMFERAIIDQIGCRAPWFTDV